MLLSRSAALGRELAIRAALGAGRARLVRQLLTESVLLSALGGGVGILLAWWGVGLLAAALPGNVPLTEQIRIDERVLGFAVAVSVLTGLLFGLAPALAASRQNDRRNRLSHQSHQSHQGWVLNSLVSAQLALALVLLTGAGLLIRSFLLLQTRDQGFRTEHLLTASIALPEAQYRGTKASDFYQELLPKLASLPANLVAGMGSDLPFEGSWFRIATPEGSTAPTIPVVNNTMVLGDYFQALGVQLKRGRFFTDADRPGAGPVIIVNETLARQFWPGLDPIGKHLTWGSLQMHLPWLTVAGVIGDVNQAAPDEKLFPHVYEPYLQTSSGGGWVRWMHLAVRTSGDPLALANAVRREVARLDPELPVTKLRTIQQILDNSLSPRRLSMWLLTVFALAALLLAALGIYGVMAYAVARRTHEIGIRMALGAQRVNVLGMIMGHGMKLAAAGLAIGLAGSLALTRLMTNLLYDVKPTDPLTYAAVALLLILIALAANFAPARRAVSVDPTVALRHE
jgi:putative ABC transport system permease protein